MLWMYCRYPGDCRCDHFQHFASTLRRLPWTPVAWSHRMTERPGFEKDVLGGDSTAKRIRSNHIKPIKTNSGYTEGKRQDLHCVWHRLFVMQVLKAYTVFEDPRITAGCSTCSCLPSNFLSTEFIRHLLNILVWGYSQLLEWQRDATPAGLGISLCLNLWAYVLVAKAQERLGFRHTKILQTSRVKTRSRCFANGFWQF